MEYLLVICSLAIGHSLFSAVALLLISRKTSNSLLALLLFLLALRTGKSVIGMFFLPGMVYELSVTGVLAMAAIGPVLLLLIKSLFTTIRITRFTYLHFLPVPLLLIALIVREWKMLSYAYYSMTAHILIYIILSVLFVYRNRHSFRADNLKWKWSLILLTGMSLLFGTFVLQVTVYQPLIYATNVVTAALVFYGLSLWAVKRSRLFLPEPSTRNENTQTFDELGKQIQQLLEKEMIFTDPNLTVSLLAAKLKAQPYLVSKTVNHFFRKSFSELLTHYRIKKAEQLLLSPKIKTYSIEGIAFESGFNTLSAFYAAFKKIHKTTPAQFREAKRESREEYKIG